MGSCQYGSGQESCAAKPLQVVVANFFLFTACLPVAVSFARLYTKAVKSPVPADTPQHLKDAENPSQRRVVRGHRTHGFFRQHDQQGISGTRQPRRVTGIASS